MAGGHASSLAIGALFGAVAGVGVGGALAVGGPVAGTGAALVGVLAGAGMLSAIRHGEAPRPATALAGLFVGLAGVGGFVYSLQSEPAWAAIHKAPESGALMTAHAQDGCKRPTTTACNFIGCLSA